ncbi:hypothetical protein [Solitalea koreensis]|uniref:Uncharacterized protein n=1 Tax=Solitalea koreensis TaxID=543615 RepID=A0A521BXZ8_9SPHI|nr:hypothetical protein [Solitalea koreensis]SMO52074.1 hypothetical protein SAMN06265350_10325 [Solitalea koreensis]
MAQELYEFEHTLPILHSTINDMKKILFLIVILIPCLTVKAQYTIKTNNPAYKRYYDSLKTMDYKYKFPILAKKAYKKGFDVPFPLGIGANYFAQRQDINISTIEIGLNDNPLTDVSDLIKFGAIIGETHAFTIRPDIWVFPFLNVYSIIGTGHTVTDVSLVDPINFSTSQRFTANSLGVGFTAAGGFGPVWVAVDNNYNWANVSVLTDPVPASILCIRVGHTFQDKSKPDRNVAVWFGPFRQKIKSDTEGNVPISSIFPDLTPGKEDEFIEDLNNWYNNLPPPRQAALQPLYQRLIDYFEGNDPGDSNIHYKLNKRVAEPWNMVFGAQYQHNKRLQIRTELGTFGKRTQFLISANYRFLW